MHIALKHLSSIRISSGLRNRICLIFRHDPWSIIQSNVENHGAGGVHLCSPLGAVGFTFLLTSVEPIPEPVLLLIRITFASIFPATRIAKTDMTRAIR